MPAVDALVAQLIGLLPLLGALLLALPVGWNRERNGNIMGIRTFPLVAVGACAYILIARTFIGDDAPDATARVLQGLMTGIGFVGGGAILKHDDHVSGTASAASIWMIGAMGAAAGFGYWGYAIGLSVINLLVVTVFSWWKRRVDSKE
ncbi:MgtC/SapB family protein [Novilysobacter spongiicola]|uniref:Protein MgtC n=1 Tax=Lysobacter spongiicola DSM 21749 TaxID=1122188 RepID=A0A1T4LLK6_9GAMM|nr:MgtC/SapB family protein [Lysobacter spongiicola]SJZ55619.1 putative Mg2+ transporter-C (MgtC) family protein [Lysobacter spongiicola DSM 21749]